MIETERLMTITQVSATPSFAEEDIDYAARFKELITASPDYPKWFEDQNAIIAFVKELAAYRTGENILRFVGSVDDEEVAYIGVSGMNMATPEIQITVKEGHRGQGYGKAMLEKVLAWLFEHTDKEAFLYRILSDNKISEKLVKGVGGITSPNMISGGHTILPRDERIFWLERCNVRRKQIDAS